MKTTSSRVSFQEVAERLGQAVEWLAGFGIRVSSTRIAKYHAAMTALVREIESGDIMDRLGQLSDTDRAALMRGHFALYFEVGEILSIYDALHGLENLEVLNKLKDFTGGPEFSSGEDSNSVFSRNIAFELQTAAHLLRNGFVPQSLLPADFKFVAEGRNIVVECKRPSVPDKIDPRVHEACKQIERRRKASPAMRLRGIVAVDLSKALGLDQQLRIVNHSTEINQYMVETMDNIVEQRRPEWVRRNNDRSIGVLIRIATLLLNRETLSPVHCQQFGYAKMFNLTATDEALSQAIGRRI